MRPSMKLASDGSSASRCGTRNVRPQLAGKQMPKACGVQPSVVSRASGSAGLEQHRDNLVRASEIGPMQGRPATVCAECQVGPFAEEKPHDLRLAVTTGDAQGVGELLGRSLRRAWPALAVVVEAGAARARGPRHEHACVVEAVLYVVQASQTRGADQVQLGPQA